MVKYPMTVPLDEHIEDFGALEQEQPDLDICSVCGGELNEVEFIIHGIAIGYLQCDSCKLMGMEEAWLNLYYGRK